MNTKENLEKILSKITDRDFLENRGLGNELGFYIFDYPPEDELFIRDYIKYIFKQLSIAEADIKPVEIDLYNIMLEILKNKKIFDKVIPMEKAKGDKELKKALYPVLKPENFIKIIKDKIEGHNLIFLTGIGKVWPLVRSHTILNNLHSVLDRIPVIMFFPGKYNQIELQLFGKFRDDNYYRAFKLIE
ncbi:MAG: DUF1788 domain-containing protein [Candidatus Eremiobacterota bacterium]